ncbi:hypothetical protein IMZ31_20035 (plasmid) [Pontibacillus sp. ALD_SL1]|uniref:hypothetical protein n=1 Tax=Pontibacillus sp. ALD_SL1 TaxID=2777185 RepID=UPI001A96DDEC|nr:hypothetical protein [Pontibacillus sp. ALD_SL1]QST02842.1 hypothetical protein IMZ31_20035 [Pontibacillus sp. ALD_SL1]
MFDFKRRKKILELMERLNKDMHERYMEYVKEGQCRREIRETVESLEPRESMALFEELLQEEEGPLMVHHLLYCLPEDKRESFLKERSLENFQSRPPETDGPSLDAILDKIRAHRKP